ncbi:MAG: T9SS type A sorting domain-containing protein, partial [bacterium]
GKVRGAPALGLVNSDSALDVIVGADDGKVYVLDGISGATIVTRSTGGPTGSAAALGDIFGTGRLDVAVGSVDGRLYLFGGAPTGVAEPRDAVAHRAVLLARPNPVTRLADVSYSVPRAGNATVTLLDAAGRAVMRLASGTHAAGTHSARLDAARRAAGVYWLKLESGSGSYTAKLTLLR